MTVRELQQRPIDVIQIVLPKMEISEVDQIKMTQLEDFNCVQILALREIFHLEKRKLKDDDLQVQEEIGAWLFARADGQGENNATRMSKLVCQFLMWNEVNPRTRLTPEVIAQEVARRLGQFSDTEQIDYPLAA